jgi:hypothetical protein
MQVEIDGIWREMSEIKNYRIRHEFQVRVSIDFGCHLFIYSSEIANNQMKLKWNLVI